jgi:hypothetical protein
MSLGLHGSVSRQARTSSAILVVTIAMARTYRREDVRDVQRELFMLNIAEQEITAGI